jgi:glycerol-3-phosphate dehydrogenase subunit B
VSRPDAIVIGTGLAGLTAAVRLAEGGARVLVLAKGVGATHLAPATIDVLGYAPERVEKPLEAVASLGGDHPYARVGADGIAAACEWLVERVAGGSLPGYAYTGSAARNLLLPTAIGVPRPSAVVPETMAGGDLAAGGPVVVVGLRPLKDFHAALCADMLTRAGIEARATEVDLRPEDRVDANSLGFARAFDDPAFRGQVVAQLGGRVLPPDARLAFPAVLGIRDPHGTWKALQTALGRPVFEVPTLPPSVPGMRLAAILREALRRAGGAVRLNNVVVGAEADGARVRALRVRVGLREERLEAGAYVLATGGIASGGLALDSHWQAREVALGLPVAGVPARERFRPDYFGEQPMARAGVAVDGELRPVGPGGEVIYENVRVAGATLAGAEPWKEKSGDGISLATGYRAAELVLEASRATVGEAA